MCIFFSFYFHQTFCKKKHIQFQGAIQFEMGDTGLQQHCIDLKLWTSIYGDDVQFLLVYFGLTCVMSVCYGLNVCVSPNSYVVASSSTLILSGGGAFGSEIILYMKLWGWRLHDRISTLTKSDTTGPSARQKEGPRQERNLSAPRLWNFSCSEIVGKQRPIFKPSIWSTLFCYSNLNWDSILISFFIHGPRSMKIYTCGQ